jgi:tetratricopeptide (TPR) repeat protein
VQQDGSVDDALVALLVKGQGALASGDWADARACFEEATRREHTGETLDGLAQALFGQGDYAAAIDSAELAFAAFHEAGNEVRAAVCRVSSATSTPSYTATTPRRAGGWDERSA